MRHVVVRLAAAVCFAAGCCAQKTDVALLRVSPTSALDTPQKALDEVLRLRRSGLVAADRQIAVEFECGTYAVDRPLEIAAEHGPLLIKGAGALGTVFSGGKRLGLFRVETNGRVWRTPAAADWAFDQLFINRKRAELSSPDKCLSPWVPGAWYRDAATHEVVYVARPGENTAGTIAIAGAVDSVLVVKEAADVTVEGVSFMHNASGPEGPCGAAVVCDGVKRLVFSGCCFRHCANYGLKVVGSSSDVTIRHCRFDDAGGGALSACGAEGLLFEDNIVANCGTTAEQAAVRIEGGRRCRVAHNDFCTLKCSGVSCSGEECESGLNRFWRVPGEKDSPREGEAGVSGKDRAWRARVELLTF